jgi:hypothetical protein
MWKFLPHKNHHVSITKPNQSVLFTEIITLYPENDTEYINTLCVGEMWSLGSRWFVHRVTAVSWVNVIFLHRCVDGPVLFFEPFIPFYWRAGSGWCSGPFDSQLACSVYINLDWSVLVALRLLDWISWSNGYHCCSLFVGGPRFKSWPRDSPCWQILFIFLGPCRQMDGTLNWDWTLPSKCFSVH